MKRYRQCVEEVLKGLSEVPSSWKDAHAEAVIAAVKAIPSRKQFTRKDLVAILSRNFKAGRTAIRLALDLSKDAFEMALRETMGGGGIGIARYGQDGKSYVNGLVQLGALTALKALANTPLSWHDLLIERLKGGRGSAIKGQARGRFLEDFVEKLVHEAFADIGYDVRTRFLGATGTSTEKADFAIPSKKDPRILIEVKAYGATGSKQTDILGDIGRIVSEKRHDTHLLLVTDGVTWRTRLNDLRNLVAMQNHGKIARIYTQKMSKELAADLKQLREDHGL